LKSKTVLTAGLLGLMSIGVANASGTGTSPNLSQPTITPLEERASNYIEFRNDIQMLEVTPIDSNFVTRDAHNRLASHDPTLLSSGWVAYAALVAADNPEFVASIKARVANEKKRNAFLSELRTNPRSVRNLDGAQAAIDSVMMMTAKDAMKIKGVGDSYISNAYALQNKGWAKKKISDGTSRVYEAQDYSNSRARMATPLLPASVTSGVRSPGLRATDQSWQEGWSTTSAAPSASPRATPIMDRVLVLAARYAVGDLTGPIVNGYAKSDSTRRCLNTAKLNLDQCIAATRTSYEEAFCLGEHGLKDVSGCVGWVAGVSGK
jgi:hypothetical protein